MNLICNNCVGARVYEALNKQYTNPFIWSLVRPDEFVYLINNYNNIDFNKRELILIDNTLSIRIDNKVTAVFVHHIKDERYSEYTKLSINNQMQARYKYMDEFILDRYDARVSRMTESPIFLISDRYNSFCNGTYTFKPESLNGIKDFSNVTFIGSEKTNLCKSLLCNGNASTAGLAKSYLKNR